MAASCSARLPLKGYAHCRLGSLPAAHSEGAMARKWSPRSCASGCLGLARRACTSSLVHPRRTATASPSMASSGMNASMARSSTASGRPRWSSRTGASTTTQSAHIRRLATVRRLLSPSHSRQHSTDNQTCNSLSFVLVQNIGQATSLLEEPKTSYAGCIRDEIVHW